MSKMVTFVEHAVPGLKAGEYSIHLKQELSKGEETLATYEASRHIAVQGERFTLPPTEVLAVYPPAQAQGEYLNSLPHIVFDRKMFPWLRSLDLDPGEDHHPWLALLVFPDNEAPPTQARQVKDLIPAGRKVTVPGSDESGTGTMDSDRLSYPFNAPEGSGDYILDVGESPDETVLCVDVPSTIFDAVAPSEEDMGLLAHVRLVEMNAKSTLGVGDYSLVIGNRFAHEGKNVVHLVSLEGLGNHLPTDRSYESRLPSETEAVRLVSLQSWTFEADGDGKALETALKGLNRDGLRVPLPEQMPIPSPEAVQAAIAAQLSGTTSSEQGQVLVRNSIAMGYVAMSHQTRAGSRTVSWYRGPLVPNPVAQTLSVPLAYPEQASAYNPRTGLLDHSYGAAWQIGQWLALQDKDFSTTLYQWKQSVSQEAIADAQNEIVNSRTQTLKSASERSKKQGARQRTQNTLVKILESQLQQGQSRRGRQSETVPENVVEWMSDLKQLKKVPFNYLVPDDRQLPTESIRFFHLDPNWMNALLDGAFSLGRTTPAELETDQKSAPRLLQQVNQRLFKSPAARSGAATPVTGFVLRSKVVAGWPGLTVQAFAGVFDPNEDLTTPLPLLRFEKISDDLILGLFEGDLRTVMFREPDEGLHFGANKTGMEYTTGLRYLRAGDGGSLPNNADPGEEISGVNAPILTRFDGNTIKVGETAEAIHGILIENDAIGSEAFTSEEFAVEMVRGATEVRFEYQMTSNTHQAGESND